MDLRERIEGVARRLRESRRRVWRGEGRVWVEVRGNGKRIETLIAAVERSAVVDWARWNAALQRLVVQHRTDPDRALQIVRDAERQVGLADLPLDGEPRLHPGDGVHERRARSRVGATALGIAYGALANAVGAVPGGANISLAAFVSAFENLPPARRWLDRTMGSTHSEPLLDMLTGVSLALTRATSAQVSEIVYQGLRWAEARAAEEVWRTREPELAMRPADHPRSAAPPSVRPSPLPSGPIERYSDPAALLSLGGFAFGVAASGRADEAAVSIFGAVPRPARLGREAFAAALGLKLAERNFLALDDRPARRLDRIDYVVLHEDLLSAHEGAIIDVWPAHPADEHEVWIRAHELFDGADPGVSREARDLRLTTHENGVPESVGAWAGERDGRRVLVLTGPRGTLGWVGVEHRIAPEIRDMVARIRALGLGLVVASASPERVAWCEPDEIVPTDARLRTAVRRLQRQGHAVLAFFSESHPAMKAADLSVALPRLSARGQRPAPWEAHLIGPVRHDPRQDALDVRWFLDALEAARRASHQSVAIAAAEVVVGVVTASEGRRAVVLRRVLEVAGIGALAAVVNGARLARQIDHPPARRETRVSWHALEPAEALTRLQSSPDGLSNDEATARLREPERPPTEWEEIGRAVWNELSGPFTPVLATGAGLSALLGAPLDAALVVGTVVASAAIGGWQEASARRAMRELEAARPNPVKVRRDGRTETVLAASVVPGDVVLLEAGDRVPADCRILHASALEVDEARLTGESIPIRKSAQPSFAAAVADRRSMLYADTIIAAGTAQAVVVAVGADTEAQRGLVGLRAPQSSGVQDRLQDLTDLTLPIAGFSAASLALLGLVRRRPIHEVLDTAVSLTVAAVPETLPLLATAAQLAAARRLATRGALVRNVAAVEALGRVDILCSDKTGTLTEGVLCVQMITTATHEVGAENLSGAGAELRNVLRVARLAPPVEPGASRHPVDRALVECAQQLGLQEEGFTPVADLPFEPGRGYHATVVERQGMRWLCVKGAPERILERSTRLSGHGPLDDRTRARLADRVENLASTGLRVLGVAERPYDGDVLLDEDVGDLDFCGFIGIADPVRPSARSALDTIRQAGVDIVMITGDHPSTAVAIARELGLEARVITGPELERMSDVELDRVLPTIRVVARATPQHKLRIVAGYQRLGRVVAMTGDGANDAPAITLAHVGVALGEAAAPAARGAADLLVTDGRIDTIVDAILEGRSMWASVRDAVSILLGGNLGELLFTLGAGLIEGGAPLGARQLMLVNLLTDAFPALMIAVRPPTHTTPERLLHEGPERSLAAALNREIAWRAAATGGSTFVAWCIARPLSSRERAATVALLTLVFTQLGQTVALGGRDRQVLNAALGSGALLFSIVQLPGLSRFAGSRTLGPFGLMTVAVSATGGVIAAAALPRLWNELDAQFSLEARGEEFLQSELGKYLLESRLVSRLRSRFGPPPEEEDEELDVRAAYLSVVPPSDASA